MKFSNIILYLIGYPGVGKYSIAQEIQNQTGQFRLMDNHHVLNPFFSLIPLDGKSPIPDLVWDHALTLRKLILDTILQASDPAENFIFTNFLEQEKIDDGLYRDITDLAQARHSIFIPVLLDISVDEHQRRIVQPERTLRFKETNPLAPAQYQFRPLLAIEHPHLLRLDVSDLSAAMAAKIVLSHIKLVCFGQNDE